MSLKEDKEGYITEEDTEGYTVLNQLVHQVALGEIQTTMISKAKSNAHTNFYAATTRFYEGKSFTSAK